MGTIATPCAMALINNPERKETKSKRRQETQSQVILKIPQPGKAFSCFEMLLGAAIHYNTKNIEEKKDLKRRADN